MKNQIVTGALLALLTLAGALLIACGGDDDGDSSDGADSPAATSTSAAESTSSDASGGDDDGTAEADDGGGIDFGDGTAVVTVGDTTYEFDMAGDFTVCRTVFGAIQVAGPSADGREIRLDGIIPPTNWDTYDDGRFDPPSLKVEDDEQDIVWVANPTIAEFYPAAEGLSHIDDYELDGLNTSGTATFINQRAVERQQTIEQVQGTFEIHCAE